jgi:hypothetical protein
MEFPLHNYFYAAIPVPDTHANKTLETLRREFKLHAAIQCITQGYTKTNFLCMTHSHIEPEGMMFPYWSVFTIRDISQFPPLGDSRRTVIAPLPKPVTTVTDDMDTNFRFINAAREKSERTVPYSLKTTWIFEHMYADPRKHLYGSIPRIEQAVCIVMRLTVTLTTVADMVDRRARKLATHMGVADAVDAEDARRQGLLAPEETRPVPWVPNHSQTSTIGLFPKSTIPRNEKPGNRIAFEEHVEMAFYGFITSELQDDLRGIRVSSRTTQKDIVKMTLQEKEATGTIMTHQIITALYDGDTLEAIQKSLEMARGLRASVKKLNQAVCMYFEPMTLSLAMSQHGRLGERSLLSRLDYNTIRNIGALCMEWIDQPITDHRAQTLPSAAH